MVHAIFDDPVYDVLWPPPRSDCDYFASIQTCGFLHELPGVILLRLDLDQILIAVLLCKKVWCFLPLPLKGRNFKPFGVQPRSDVGEKRGCQRGRNSTRFASSSGSITSAMRWRSRTQSPMVAWSRCA